MEQRVCSFCGSPLEPGTGLMFIKKDGTVYYFNSKRCQTSLLKQGRLARRIKWTRHYPRGAKSEIEVAEKQAVEAAKAGATGTQRKAKVKREVKVKATGE